MKRGKLKVLYSEPYGRELFYPNCKESKRLAVLMKVKAFSRDKMQELKDIGYEIEINVPIKEIKI